MSDTLWPYAYNLSVELQKFKPWTSDGKIPLHLFSGIHMETHSLDRLHTFGCSAYVLDSSLQGGFKINKQLPRSRVGMYLGPSPNHARSVHMILSVHTKQDKFGTATFMKD